MGRSSRRSNRLFIFLSVGVLAALPGSGGVASGAAVPPQVPDWERLGREAVELTRAYLRIDTSNPPGNEIEAARFFARYLEAAGIPHETFESEPGRGNIVARLRGDGSGGGAVVLLNHMDVVPADPEHWGVDPFGGEIRDGFIYGRGASDMKAYGAVQLVAFLALHRSGVRLSRDVIFMGTAGEETGGFVGAGFVVDNRPDLLEGVEFLLTEGGAGARRVGGRTVHSVEVTQKIPVWLRLRVTGPAGHGSQPRRDSAVNRLVRALERIRTFRSEIKLVPPVAEALRARALYVEDPALAEAYRQIETSIQDPAFLDSLLERDEPLLRNTISITVLQGSPKTNVIPPVARAELDCRLLPGEDPDLFVATLADVIDDPGVRIERILVLEAAESPRDTPLWRAIEAVARREDSDAVVVPMVLAGFTDSHFFRRRGVVAYGWSPFVASEEEGPAHGTDERISVANVRRGPRLLYELLLELAG